MAKNGGGKIINIASLSSFIGLSNISIYGVSKGGVKSMTRQFAVEMAKHNIQVNAISPGYFKTELTADLFKDEERGQVGTRQDSAGTAGNCRGSGGNGCISCFSGLGLRHRADPERRWRLAGRLKQNGVDIWKVNMKKKFGMAVIGLGVVGRRMIEQVAIHDRWHIAGAYDLDPATCASIRKDHPEVPLADSAAAAIESPGVDLVYVAVPPLYHRELVKQTIAAKVAVLCEKPLGIDIRESTALAMEMNQSGLPQAVNFVFSSAAAVERLALALASPDFGLRAVEIRLHFHEWPRDWQSGALWLTRSDQGGFVREVMSHFVFLMMLAPGDDSPGVGPGAFFGTGASGILGPGPAGFLRHPGVGFGQRRRRHFRYH